jgi:hypothetical protein
MNTGHRFVMAIYWTGVAALASCQGAAKDSEASVVELSGANAGENVDVARGDEIDLQLQTIGPGEYETPSISSDAVRFVGVSYVTPAVPGGPTQLFQFEAAQSGHAQISIPSSGAGPAFTVDIDVRQ